MRKALFAIILLALVLVPEASFTSATQVEASTPATVFIPYLAIKSNPSPSAILSATSESEQVSSFGLYRSQQDWLYPQDIDPPETCNVPRLAPLGGDIEMMFAPWREAKPLLALEQTSTWNDEEDLNAVLASTNLDMITLTTEDIVAVWADEDRSVKYATWGAVSGWSNASQLGTDYTDGDPVLISRGPRHWAVFARFGAKIKVIEWYMGSLGDSWRELPGVNDAASDPVVISQDAGHMAVFYRTAGGEVKFTEWEGTWYRATISLDQPSEGGIFFPIASELNAISRNATHAAVFGVDASGGLWYRERTSLNEVDWSDTFWIRVLVGVEVAKPAVTSRNANHIGVVVKDSSGQPYYTRWTWVAPLKLYLPLVQQATSGMISRAVEVGALSLTQAEPPLGWSQPVPLGVAAFSSPMTLVQRSRDSLVAFGITDDGSLFEILWTEDEGWGSWQVVGGGNMMSDQVVVGVTRRMNDVMLLGRYSNNQVWSKNYTSLDKPVMDEALSSALEGLPRGQVLAIIEGRWVWVSVTRQTIGGIWQVAARELSTGVSANLDLIHEDSGQTTNRMAVAAADLDVDGNAEVVVATLNSNQSNIDLSVLELSFQDPTTLIINASPLFEWTDPVGGEDVNVAIGDLDGDQERDEVVVGYRSGSNSMRLGIFQYTEYGLAPQGGTTEINFPDYCAGVPNCMGGQHDMEMTTGRVAREFIPPLEREQLVVLDVSAITLSTPGVTYAQDWIMTERLITETWSLEPVVPGGCQFLHPSTNPGVNSSIAADPYTAGLGTGDMDADGMGNIVYSFGDILAVITDTFTCGYQVMPAMPDQERSLVVGDFDTDGRGETALAYRGSTTTMNMIEMVEDSELRTSAQRTVTGSYTILAADTDNDTYVAELAGCKTFADIQVVAVVNGAPRWYQDGQPIQNSRGLYGCTEEDGGGEVEDGTTTSNGVSVSIGFEYEADYIPGGNNHDFGFRIFGGYEYIHTTGTRTETSWSQTRELGYDYDAPSLGMVVYNSTEFTCYFYDAYPPTEPEAKSRLMMCSPTGRVSAEDFKPLEDWHSSHFKQAAGPSWADVGHLSPGGIHTNDLEVPGNYPRTLPETKVMYAWEETPIKVSYSSVAGFYNYWHLSEMEGEMTENITTDTHNGTAGAGGTAWGVFVDVAWVGSWTFEDSNVTSWANTLEIGGGVEKFQDPTKEGLCYDIVPYIYQAKTRTLAGVVYPYFEMDFYLPLPPDLCALQHEGSSGDSWLSQPSNALSPLSWEGR